MPEIKEQARTLRTAVDAKRAEAAAAWAAFDAMRKSARDEGVDFLTNEDAFTKLDAAGKVYDGLAAEVVTGEQKWARLIEMAAVDDPAGAPPAAPTQGGDQGGNGKARASYGQMFTGSAAYKELKASGQLDVDKSRVDTSFVKVIERGEVKTLLSSLAASAGDWVVKDRLDLLVYTAQPSLTVLDLITITETDSNLVAWMEETTFTNAAAETAEDTAAAESALVYDEKTSAVKEITHFIPATKRILADEARLTSLVNERMVYGVRKRLQSQVVAGDGAGENLTGIVNTSGISAQALGSDTRTDAVHKAITKIRVAGEDMYDPTAIGIHPNDWEQLRLEKDANGSYQLGPANGSPATTVWGLTPVVHTAFPEGNPVVGDFRGAELAIREGVSVAASDSHSDYFVKRKVAILATLRGAFFVPQPLAFCELTGM